jgi:hypothetical protein
MTDEPIPVTLTLKVPSGYRYEKRIMIRPEDMPKLPELAEAMQNTLDAKAELDAIDVAQGNEPEPNPPGIVID